MVWRIFFRLAQNTDTVDIDLQCRLCGVHIFSLQNIGVNIKLGLTKLMKTGPHVIIKWASTSAILDNILTHVINKSKLTIFFSSIRVLMQFYIQYISLQFQF